MCLLYISDLAMKEMNTEMAMAALVISLLAFLISGVYILYTFIKTRKRRAACRQGVSEELHAVKQQAVSSQHKFKRTLSIS